MAEQRTIETAVSGLAGRRLGRRSFLAAGGLAAFGLAASPLLAACGGDSSSDASGKSMVFSTPPDAVATIKEFESYADSFTTANPGTKVSVVLNGTGSFDQWLQAHLAARNAPDVLRITPTQIGRYIANGGMLDISQYLPKNYGDDFNQTFWSQVAVEGKTFGIPQCVDTTAIFYRKDILSKVGARIPTSPQDAWNWDEFTNICDEVKKVTGKYAFSYQWSTGAGYYWLPVLYQHGGSLVKDDLTTPAITDDTGIEALQWSRDWFAKGYISPSNTIQGTTGDAPINLFTTGQVGMMINGDWKLTNVQQGGLNDDQWDVTYMFRDVVTASLVGGTNIGVTRDAKNPELAAQLAQWICNNDNMASYCKTTLFLPARKSLLDTTGAVPYIYRPEAVKKFVEQVQAIPQSMFALQTSKNFGAINDALSSQIALCFNGQQSPKDTAANIADSIKSAGA
jgi:multiple sugar transport system substrate-binding protein